MAASPQPIPVPPNLPKLWLTVLRIAVGASILEFLLFVLAVPLPVLALCAVAYVVILIGLFSGFTDFAARASRAFSLFLFPATTFYMLAIAFDETLPGVAPRLVMALAAATQFVVVYASSRYCEPPRGKKKEKEKGRDWEAIAQKAFPFVVVVGAFVLIVVFFFGGRFGMTPGIQAKMNAVQSTFQVYVCAQLYSATHADEGFPASLEALGRGEPGCVPPEVLESGGNAGYTFQFTPGAPDERDRINNFTFVARSNKILPDAEFSYFVSEAGLVHYTDEDRDPTPEDPHF